VFGDHPAKAFFGRQARRDSFVGLLGYVAALAEFYEAGWFMASLRVQHAARRTEDLRVQPQRDSQCLGDGF
jgi:hypothetical protein